MLEEQIAKLNDNIKHLNSLLEAMADAAKTQTDQTVEPKQGEPVEPKADPEQPKDPENVGYTHDSIKAIAMRVVRKDRSTQAKIKEKLAEYGARVMTDLDADNTTAMGEWLYALKCEVGA